MTLVILSGAIDLSVGSLIALVTVVIAFALDLWADPSFAVAAGLLIALVAGAMNRLKLDVIAAVVIGGGSLSGGQGSVIGSLIGAIIMATVRAGGSQMGMPNWVQQIATGAIIMLAVALDRWRQAARSARAEEVS